MTPTGGIGTGCPAFQLQKRDTVSQYDPKVLKSALKILKLVLYKNKFKTGGSYFLTRSKLDTMSHHLNEASLFDPNGWDFINPNLI